MRASACADGLAALGHDRPVDQREEGELVARDVEADRLAGFERGALGEKQREALQAGLADVVDLGVAGDDIGEVGLDASPCMAKSSARGIGAAAPARGAAPAWRALRRAASADDASESSAAMPAARGSRR